MRNAIIILLVTLFNVACNEKAESINLPGLEEKKMDDKMETITLGGGCFWCVEAVFLSLNGVQSVESGYMGGKTPNPTYKDVCTGMTGHAEVIRIHFDPSVVTLEEILEVFFTVHDPTTLNRQGADVGTQYRSAIFYSTEEQGKKAREIIDLLNKNGVYTSKVVTEVTPAATFYKAEDYHQNYYNNNSGQGYCRMVIQPKLDKFRKVFPDKQKK